MNAESRIISDDICDALGVARGSLVWSYINLIMYIV